MDLNFKTLHRCGSLFIIISLIWVNLCLAESRSIIAVVVPRTGDMSETGMKMEQAIDLALVEGDVAKKLKELDVEFRIFDNQSDEQVSDSLAISLKNDDSVKTIIGGFPGSCCAAIIKRIQNSDLPLLIISSADDSLTIDSPANVFRLCAPASEHNGGLVAWAATVVGEMRPIALAYADNNYCENAKNDFIRDMRLRWRGPYARHSFREDTKDFTELLKQVEIDRPVLLWFLGSRQDAAGFMKYCREVEWSPTAFVMGTVDLVDNRLIALSENAANYVFAPMIWWHTVNIPEAEIFTRTYKNRYDETPDHHAAEAYSAVKVVTQSLTNIEEAGLDRSNIREQLEQIRIATVVGNVDFEAFKSYQRQNRMQTYAMQHQNGKWVVVWPPLYAEEKYIYPPPDWVDRQRFKIETVGKKSFIYIFVAGAALLLYILIRIRFRQK